MAIACCIECCRACSLVIRPSCMGGIGALSGGIAANGCLSARAPFGLTTAPLTVAASVIIVSWEPLGSPTSLLVHFHHLGVSHQDPVRYLEDVMHAGVIHLPRTGLACSLVRLSALYNRLDHSLLVARARHADTNTPSAHSARNLSQESSESSSLMHVLRVLYYICSVRFHCMPPKPCNRDVPLFFCISSRY